MFITKACYLEICQEAVQGLVDNVKLNLKNRAERTRFGLDYLQQHKNTIQGVCISLIEVVVYVTCDAGV